MDWSEVVEQQLVTLKSDAELSDAWPSVVQFLDYTSLGKDDDAAQMTHFFQQALSLSVKPAAVCVWPQFVRQAAECFADSATQVATVLNFPQGDARLETVLVEMGRVIAEGATEVDVVMPYHRYLAGEQRYIQTFVEACKEVCGDQVLLKVILETGVLSDLPIIADASYTVLSAGADFIKTSTGKVAVGASLDAAATMLLVIKHLQSQVKRDFGFKASGGIRSLSEAQKYAALAAQIMGKSWVNSKHFRLGSSQTLVK